MFIHTTQDVGGILLTGLLINQFRMKVFAGCGRPRVGTNAWLQETRHEKLVNTDRGIISARSDGLCTVDTHQRDREAASI